MSDFTYDVRRRFTYDVRRRTSRPGQTSSMTEAEARRVITGTFKQLDAWEAATGPFIPGSGSDLKGDDYDWPHFGVSQVAWSGLQAALDSLQAIRWHLDARSRPRSGTSYTRISRYAAEHWSARVRRSGCWRRRRDPCG